MEKKFVAENYNASDKDILDSKGLAIHFCGREVCRGGHFFGPSIRQQYLLHFIVEGKGRYCVGNKEYNISKNQAFLIRPKESTYYKADEENPWEYIWIAFNGYEANEIVKSIGFENDYVVKVNNPHDFKKHLLEIIDQFIKGNNSIYKILACFYNAISQLETRNDLQKAEYEYFGKAKEYIQNNYSYQIKISDLANYVGIDRTYLYKIFKSEQNISPKSYLLQVRINAAKSMLMTGEYSINEIALSCGFSDSPAFCNQFKKLEGKSPKKFSEELKNKKMI